ncbi:TetR/AcrR family transcriptional regulator [Ectopseudomonas chengduensis]|nr:TetR/AcrR family transcriptional regulator [Pseudomonas chengduensis]WKC36601.1 TetR/AcrR family transcriptional regulator [Pseudomonas chengduensis]
MARPKLHSDETILDATCAVLKRLGPSAFTLNDVANEVGISRAALIQRFKNRDTLLHHAMERSVLTTREFLEKLPFSEGAQGLWLFLLELSEALGTGESYEVNLLIAWHEVQDPVLRELARKRNVQVQQAILERVPLDTAHEPKVVASLFHALIGGATLQWLATREGRLDSFVAGRLREAIRLFFPGIRFSLPPKLQIGRD